MDPSNDDECIPDGGDDDDDSLDGGGRGPASRRGPDTNEDADVPGLGDDLDDNDDAPILPPRQHCGLAEGGRGRNDRWREAGRGRQLNDSMDTLATAGDRMTKPLSIHHLPTTTATMCRW